MTPPDEPLAPESAPQSAPMNTLTPAPPAKPPVRWAVPGAWTVDGPKMCAAVRGLVKQRGAYGPSMLPILSHVKLFTQWHLGTDDRGPAFPPSLCVEMTSLDVTMQWSVPVSIATPGVEALVPLRALHAACMLPDAARLPWTITVRTDPLDITITIGMVSMNALEGALCGAKLSDWPDTEQHWTSRRDGNRTGFVPGARTAFHLRARDFLRVAFDATRFASDDHARPVLHGVMLRAHATRGCPVAVATNGHRLVELRLEDSTRQVVIGTPVRDHYICSREALSALARAGTARVVTIEVCEALDEDWLRAENGPLVVFARVIPGPFPSLDRIWPRGPSVAVTVRSAAKLRLAARRVYNVLTRLGRYGGTQARSARLLVRDDRATLAALGQLAKGGELDRMRLVLDLTGIIDPPEREGDGFGVCVSTDYLQQALRPFGRNAVLMRGTGAASPLVFTTADTTVLLMPMRHESVPEIDLWVGGAPTADAAVRASA